VVQLGSLLTKRAAYTAGKVIISMIQAFIGRVYSSGRNVTPSLVLHIDEAQSVLYQGIEDLFAKAGGAGVFIHGYCQSISQLHAEVGEDRANTILDNCNTKIFLRVPDPTTADYVSQHLGEARRFSPIISLGGSLSIRETEEVRIKPSEILNLAPRELYLLTYTGTYKGKTATVSESTLKVTFPDLAQKTISKGRRS
jgi:conjugal transfer pilus assembly protein TraD